MDASANAELERELETRTRELAEAREHLAEALARETATSEVLQVISSSPGGLEPVFESMLANATRICEASYGTLWLCDGSGFRAVALHGALPSAFTEQLRDGRIWHPSEAVAITRVARTLQTVQVDDLSADQGYLDRAPLYVAAVELAGIRTLIVVPMLKESEMVGAIAIYRREVRPFTGKQIALVQNFAAQAVIAIENTPCSTSSASPCSSRPPPPTCSRSSAARPSICKWYSILWSNQRRDCVRRILSESGSIEAQSIGRWHSTELGLTSSSS